MHLVARFCRKCRKTKLLSQFQKYRDNRSNGKIRLHSWCKECRCADTNQWRESITGRANARHWKEKRRGEILFHCQRRIHNWRKKDLTSDLTPEYLVNLYDEQGGRCYYTGRPMIVGRKRFEYSLTDALSLDRLDPEKGYNRGNVVWCINLVNTMKQRMKENEFYDFLHTILRYSKEGRHHVA
jgi:hypothetical protein